MGTSYETKVLLALIASRIAKSETLEEAYRSIADAASIEGLSLPPFEEAKNGKKSKD